MKDHILCAIDFSESSSTTLRWANKVAAGTGSPLTVLYAYRLIQTGKVPDILLFKRKTEEESRMKFGALENGFADTHKTSITFVTEIGFFSDVIEKFIRKNPSTLVVMSEQLANNIYDHKGETLMEFLRALNTPVMIVPHAVALQNI